MSNTKYLARICWNTAGWRYPTGDASATEGKTFAADSGFGHEEWIFDFSWLLEGWKYSFLQPVNKSSDKVMGNVIDLLLYTVGPAQTWYYVGEISNVEVLEDAPAKLAFKDAKNGGWLTKMIEQVKAVHGDPASLRNHKLFCNIRFRPEDAVIYDEMIPVGEKDALRKQRRYSLVEVKDKVVAAERDWRKRVAESTDPATGQLHVLGRTATSMDLAHNELSKDLRSALRKRFGKEAVVAEEDFVDLKVHTTAGALLFELKSDARPRFAIREAIGQLLEHAYRCQANGEKVAGLVVAAPGALSDVDARYVAHLRERYQLPLQYLCFRRGMTANDLSSLVAPSAQENI